MLYIVLDKCDDCNTDADTAYNIAEVYQMRTNWFEDFKNMCGVRFYRAMHFSAKRRIAIACRTDFTVLNLYNIKGALA